MKNSPKVQIIKGKKNPAGFSLSADFVAEHEWGIDRMVANFERSQTVGELQVNQNEDPELSIVSYNGKTFLTNFDFECLHNGEVPEEFFKYMIYKKNSELGGAWDDEFFVIQANTEKDIKLFNKLVEAEKEKALFVGGNRELGRGLVIVDTRELPYHILNKMKNK